MPHVVRVSSDLIEKAMTSAAVRTKLAIKADEIAKRAHQIRDKEMSEMDPAKRPNIVREDGTRPKGRPFSEIRMDDALAEFGDSKTKRRRILGRAAE